MAEELFKLAILRLGKAAKLRKEALDYYKAEFGSVKEETEKKSACIESLSPILMKSIEERKLKHDRKSMSLK